VQPVFHRSERDSRLPCCLEPQRDSRTRVMGSRCAPHRRVSDSMVSVLATETACEGVFGRSGDQPAAVAEANPPREEAAVAGAALAKLQVGTREDRASVRRHRHHVELRCRRRGDSNGSLGGSIGRRRGAAGRERAGGGRWATSEALGTSRGSGSAPPLAFVRARGGGGPGDGDARAGSAVGARGAGGPAHRHPSCTDSRR
jgi:hypothetical protein